MTDHMEIIDGSTDVWVQRETHTGFYQGFLTKATNSTEAVECFRMFAGPNPLNIHKC